MKVIRFVTFTDANICPGSSWSFFGPPVTKQRFPFFSLLQAKTKVLCGAAMEVGARTKPSLWNPCSWGRESRGPATSPTELRPQGSQGRLLFLWNGVRFPSLSVDPLRGKLKGHCGNCYWRLCTGTGNDKCAGTRAYCKGNCFGFLFPNSLRNPPAWIRCLFGALLCKRVHLTVSFPH